MRLAIILFTFIFSTLASTAERIPTKLSKFIKPVYLGSPLPLKIDNVLLYQNSYKGGLKFLHRKKREQLLDLAPELKKNTKYSLSNNEVDYLLALLDSGKWKYNEILDSKNKVISFFLQINEIDVDEDGIPNYFDKDPFDKKVRFADFDNDGIPNHLDWDKDNDGVSELVNIKDANEMSKIQLDIYNSSNIIIYAEDRYTNLNSMRSIYEILETVFHKYIEKNNGHFPKLKRIALGNELFADSEDNSTLAYYHGYYEKVYIYGDVQDRSDLEFFRNKKSLAFYKTVIHELAHGVQQGLDGFYGSKSYDDYLMYFWKPEQENIGKVKWTSNMKEFLPDVPSETLADYFNYVLESPYLDTKKIQSFKENYLKLGKFNYAFWDHLSLLDADSHLGYLVEKKNNGKLTKEDLEILNSDEGKIFKGFKTNSKKLLYSRFPFAKITNKVSNYSLTKSGEFFAENLTAYAFYTLGKVRLRSIPVKERSTFWKKFTHALRTRVSVGWLDIENISNRSLVYFEELLELDTNLKWVTKENWNWEEQAWDTGYNGYWKKVNQE